MQVKFTKSFHREVERYADSKLAFMVNYAIENCKSAGSLTDITNMKKLSGHKNAYRIRTGNYRIGILIENGTIVFSRFLHRKEIYRYFP